jgi:hypothetical protein
MLATETMPTLEERENLMNGTFPKYTGFTPRPNEKLAVKRKPKSMLDIECNHFLRTSNEHFVHGHPNLGYKLWLEAGKHDSPYPPHPDPNFNSNIWRNFRKEYGFQTTAEGRRIGDIIATMYPLNIPAPSKVGSHTFDKYLRETKIFRNEKFQALAINRTKADVQDFKRLRIKSDARNPPLDEIGNLFFFVFVIAVFFNMPVLVGWFIVFNATLKKIYIFSLYLDGQFYCWRELE